MNPQHVFYRWEDLKALHNTLEVIFWECWRSFRAFGRLLSALPFLKVQVECSLFFHLFFCKFGFIRIESILMLLSAFPVRRIFRLKLGVAGQGNILANQDILHFADIDRMSVRSVGHCNSGGHASGLTGPHALRDQVQPVNCNPIR